jgi:hypothetical protein
MKPSVPSTDARVRYGTTPSQTKNAARSASKPASASPSDRLDSSKSIGANVSDGGSATPAAASSDRFHSWVAG